MHVLGLYIPEVFDPRVIAIKDVSAYDKSIKVSSPLMQIQIPGNTSWYNVPFPIGAVGYYTSMNFIPGAGSMTYLPDGIYQANWSVCPNDSVYTVKKFLRDNTIRLSVLTKMSSIVSSQDNIVLNPYGKNITDKKLLELRGFLNLLDCAKADVEGFAFKSAEDKLTFVNTEILNF